MSFNIEMTEVTGGTFWKSCTPGQVAGTEPFQPLQVKEFTDIAGMADMMETFPPIDLYNNRLGILTNYLGPA